MSLDLLKERFGHSAKKQTDNKEMLNEKLKDKFNTIDVNDIKSFKAQHRGEIEEKNRIIENLEIETSELTNQVLNLEKEKSTIIEDLNNSKWMENTIASNTKKIYEDKIKTMSYVDSTDLIPLLIEVSRKKQGNEKLNWSNWLKIPESRYLFQINENIARKVFEDTSVLIDRTIAAMNKKRIRGGNATTTTTTSNSSITFTGPANNTDDGPYVSTEFDPVDYELYNGFTVSFWVKPDDLGTHMFALGRRRATNTGRFTFGLNKAVTAYMGIGNTKITTVTHGMSVGNWYHWVITYGGDPDGGGDGRVIFYINNSELFNNSNPYHWNEYENGIPIFFGARNVKNMDYNNGWDCSLDEIAIFDEVKNGDWVESTYNSGNPADLQGQSGLKGYWKFNEGSGTTVKDYSGEDNNGTLTTENADLPTWSEDVPKG